MHAKFYSLSMSLVYFFSRLSFECCSYSTCVYCSRLDSLLIFCKPPDLLKINNREKTEANNGLFEAKNAAFSSEHIVHNISNLSETLNHCLQT